MDNFDSKIEHFRATVEAQTKARYIADGYTSPVHEPQTLAKIKIGKKYANVDVGSSGKYMVVMDTGEIFGIKAYGVIHRGHSYGTLDTIDGYEWGGYRAVRKAAVAA